MALPSAGGYRHGCIRRCPSGPKSRRSVTGDVSEVGWLSLRCCSRTACKHPPVYTLTYVYRDSTAVLGPLATYVEPHCYDLCEKHATRLTAPRGWDVVRLPVDPDRADDLEALANAVMETQPQRRLGKDVGKDVGKDASKDFSKDVSNAKDKEPVGQGVEVGRRGHLRVLRSGPPHDR
jgi:Protein of unknown function (DUF3499)